MAGGKIDILVEPDLTGFNGKLQAGLHGATGAAGAVGRGIGLALVAGMAAAAVGFKEIITLGNQYQGTLNELQAVSGATGAEMARVASTAKDLGSDLTLSGVSAADAAGAMLELAKGGLSLDEAMQAAKGTLQLAGAAQIDGARAAEIQAQALNQFGLAATDAGRVADVLANTANAASGGIEDIALSMKYVGPIASSMSVSIEDTATAIGLLANNGIMADSAGTALRGMLASLANPSKKAQGGLDALGISAFDAQGKFVGFRTIIDQLATAQGRMTEEQFASAAAMAFGREPLAAITALAREGGPAFDAMREAVGRQGGAAEVAAAKMKGLGGAMEGLKSNLETAAIGIYEIIDGPLEDLVRAGAAGVESFNDMLAGLGGGGLPSGLAGIASLGQDLFGNLVGILGNVRDAARPVVDGIMAVVNSMSQGGGAGGVFMNTLRGIGSAAEFASGVLQPVGAVVGGLLQLFAQLPGPIQASVLALAALRFAPSLLGGLQSGLRGVRVDADGTARATGLLGRTFQTATGPVTGLMGATRQFNSEMRLQRSLAAAAGQPIGRLAGYQAAFETSTLGAVVAARNFRDSVRAIQTGAAAAGQPISTLTAAVRALGERSPAINAMATSFTTASSAVSRGADVIAAGARRAAESVGPGLARAVTTSVTAFRAVPSAVSGAATALGSGVANAARTAGTSLATIPGHVARASASLGTGLASAARTAGDAFRAVPATVSAAMTTAGAAVRRFPTVVQGAFRAIPGAIEGSISALGRFAGAAAGIGAGAFSGLVRAGGSLVSFLGGPWGVALAAAGVALTLLGQKQAEAAAEAQAHQAALDQLRGTLDEYSGAVTQATVNEKAKQLAQDGTLQKVKQLGVSTQDYVRASLGEEAALKRVQGQLTTHTRGLIEASTAYQGGQMELRNLGLTLDDLTAAAQGNQPAIDKVSNAIGRIPDLGAREGVRMLVDGMIDAGKASGDLAAELGISNGELEKIQQQTRDAAEASGDFAAKLDLLKAGLGGLKDGGEQTEQLRTGLQGVATSAGEAATRAGEVAAEIGGIAAGGQAAAQSMQQSRDAFMAAAQEAGLTAEQAAALANQLGLIPEVARLRFETNASEATAQVAGVAASFAALPDAKEVTVQALTEEAQGQLESLGLRVEQLPDGTFRVHADTAEAKANLAAFTAGVSNTSATVKIGADDMPAQQALGAVLQQIAGGAAEVTINGQSMPAQAALSFVLGMIDGSTGTVQIAGQDQPAQAVLSAYIAAVNAGSGTVQIGGNAVPADQVLQALIAAVTGSNPSITVGANATPANSAISETVTFANGSTGTITVDGNAAPADGKIRGSVALADGSTGTITIDGNQAPANGKITATIQYADGSTGTVTINANDAAAVAAINRLKQPTSSTHTVRVRVTGSVSDRAWNANLGNTMAAGGIVEPMAAGGHLTPMAGGLARVVKPNTWRVIGDRMIDDEAYIPINRSARSRRIFEETARRMGYTVARMYANGGIADDAARVARSVASMASSSGGPAPIVAQLAQLRAELGAIRARQVEIVQNFNVPSAERASDRAAHGMRRLGQLGLFA